MILVFGGAYQGKLEYALATFHKTQEDVFYCADESTIEIGFNWQKPIIYGLENWVKRCLEEGAEPWELLAEYRNLLADKIFICCDVSQGVVPMEPEVRAYREMMGRTLIYLAKEAQQVHRVFCGLGQRLK
ncbi:MAG: cobalamin biosynthesis protein CobU [Firmicutes bacterium]|nr:cobalamin biosynthesis protein CobU [Bacillota bacterium]